MPYNPETGEKILEMIQSGITLTEIATLPDMPSLRTIYQWTDDNPDFAQEYARARQKMSDTLADRVLIESMTSHDAPIGRLRMDALRWYASKLAPKKYGDKVEVEQTGNTNFKISFAVPDRNTQDSLTELPVPIVTPQLIDIEAEPVKET